MTRRGFDAMKKIALVGLIVVAATALLVPPSEAHGRRFHRGGVRTSIVLGFGPAYYWGPYPHWHYYPPPYVVYSPPPVVVQEAPPVYVQQTPPPPAPSAQAAESYWYYCQSAGAYYPSVGTCPEEWVKVPPRP
jgi:hypothetical protein